MQEFKHITVLKKETVENLNPQKGDKFIDATLGGGGHTDELLKKGAKVLGIDRDMDAIKHATQKYKNSPVIVKKGTFSNLKHIASENNFLPSKGIIFDLGVSSHQIDSQSRGFSLKQEAFLDMRMDTSQAQKASDLIDSCSTEELKDILELNAEVPDAYTIASEIKEKLPNTTTELRNVIRKVIPSDRVVAQVFMALRMEVNSEIEELKEGLKQGVEIAQNTIAIITFHSIEDRVVKQFAKKNSLKLKTIKPSQEEINNNKRAKSATLRVLNLK